MSSPPVLEEAWQVDSGSFWFYLTFRGGRRLARLGGYVPGYSVVGNRSYVSWDDAQIRAFGDVAEARALVVEVKALRARAASDSPALSS